jgi:hypothetical protein
MYNRKRSDTYTIQSDLMNIQYKVIQKSNSHEQIPYILESNAHPNLMRTQFLATS